MIADPTIAHFVACFAGGPCTAGELVIGLLTAAFAWPMALVTYALIRKRER